MAGKLSNDDLKAAFDQCQKNGTAEEWDTLGMAYYNHGYVLNAGYCFKRADEIRAQPKLIAGADFGGSDVTLVNVTLKNREPLVTRV